MTFVGRESELAELARRYDTARAGRGLAVLVTGPPGIGKSALLQAFARALHSRGARFAFGGNLHREQSACAPFREALGDEYLSRLESPAASLLAIEDIQWADDATLELIARLQRHIANQPMLLLLTIQTSILGCEKPSPALAHLLPALDDRIDVAPLGLADIRALIRERAEPVAVATARRIERTCAGNPRYLCELLDAPSAPVPRSFLATLEGVLTSLAPQQRRLVECAAVLGANFDLWLLAAIARRKPAAIALDLQALHDGGIVTAGAGASDFAFAHPLVREAIYARIPPAARSLAHAAAAKEIEKHEAGVECDALLAEHWYASPDPGRSIEYARRAADAAETLGAFAEAAHWHECVLEFTPPDGRERAEQCRRLGFALYSAGLVIESRPYFEEAAAFFSADGNPQAAAELLRLLATALWFDGNGEAALTVVEEAIVHLRDCRDSAVTSHLLVKAAGLCDLIGKRERSLELLERIEKSSRQPSRDLRSRYYNVRGCCNAHAGRFDDAVADFRLALRDQRGTRHHDVMIAVSQNAHACLRSAGRYEEAEAQARAALEYARQHNIGLLLESTLGLLQADLLAMRGKVAEAVRLVEAVVSGDLDFELLRMELLACGLSVALVADRQDLIDLCYRDRDVQVVFEGRDPMAIGAVVAAVARLYAARGQLAAARALLRRGLREAHGSDLVETLALAVAEFGTRADAKRGRMLLAAMNPGQATPAFLGLYDALVAHRRGDVRETQRHAAAAAAIFQALGVPLLAARGFELAGRQKRALAIYRECGAVRDANRLQSVFTGRGRRSAGPLTQRQLQIGRSIAAGQNNRAIARDLNISGKTLESHLTAIYRRLGVADRSGIAAYLFERELA